MPIDINGYNLSKSGSAFFPDLVLGASSSKIASANYGVLCPALPGMMGSVTAGGGYKRYPWPINDVNPNTGSCWSTSTFRFTAPVTGVYYTSFSGICGNGAVGAFQGYYGLIINGVLNYFSYRDTSTIWELHHVEMMVNLAAGDWFSWAMNISPGPDSGTVGGAYTANHNTSTIWLVG